MPESARVSEFDRATCPSCDARYAVHVDGACPQCGTALVIEPDYAAHLVAGFEGIVRQYARAHAPAERYPTCAACVETTPLACDAARDVPKANLVTRVVTDADAAVEHLGDDPHWVHAHLTDAYIEAFYEACASPADCEVCHDAAVAGTGIECGHQRTGSAHEDCPAC